MLRHPVERAHSSYWYYVTRGQELTTSFEDALDPERWVGDGPRSWHFTQGLYHAHLSAYFALFPREQIKVYIFEDWRQAPQAMLRDLSRLSRSGSRRQLLGS